MTAIRTCPVCEAPIDAQKVNIDREVLKFLVKLRKDNTLNEYLKIAKKYIDIMRQTAPTATIVTKAISIMKAEVKDIASKELDELASELPSIIQKTLQGQMPDSEKLQRLSEILPKLLITMNDLLRKQEVPQIKGEIGEQELADELSTYYPEDEVERLGKSGEPDIILRPRLNGLVTGYEIVVESKKNSGWRRSFLDQVQRHLSDYGCHYAILAVQVMPKGANGYITEFVEEGTIFVTSRENCKVAYGALRAVLLSEHTLGRKAVNLQVALSDIRIQEAINTAFKSTEHLESIRKKAKTILRNARGIEKDADAVEDAIRESLTDLQRRICQAIEKIPSENPPQTPVPFLSPSSHSRARATTRATDP